jgi:hypothetical protein
MSNAERWDHGGYEGMMKGEKHDGQNIKRGGMGQKKVFYNNKYKEQNSFNDKTMFSDYIDHNQNNRKNPNKKYPYNNNQGKVMTEGNDYEKDKQRQQ